MTTFDWILLAVLGTSLLLGASRGLIYEAVSLASWVAAFVLSQRWAEWVGGMLPLATASSVVRLAAGFVLVFVTVLFAGILLAWLLKTLAGRLGLRPADRTLGAAFGLARGLVILLVLALFIQATPLKTQDWWIGSVGASLLLGALRGAKDLLPPGWMAPWVA